MSEKKKILVVDDEPDFAAIVQRNLEKVRDSTSALCLCNFAIIIQYIKPFLFE